ncbi:MAG: hypothetical protein LUO89_06945, partial [Methanothrix sp.]|nr:hypothetical protein [Methanothrix sp.]
MGPLRVGWRYSKERRRSQRKDKRRDFHEELSETESFEKDYNGLSMNVETKIVTFKEMRAVESSGYPEELIF